MTWFGYAFGAWVAFGTMLHVARAGEKRDPWPEGWLLVGVLAIQLAWIIGIYTVGVRP